MGGDAGEASAAEVLLALGLGADLQALLRGALRDQGQVVVADMENRGRVVQAGGFQAQGALADAVFESVVRHRLVRRSGHDLFVLTHKGERVARWLASNCG